MDTDKFDFLWAALHKWLEATTHEERSNILLQHPELLGDETDAMFDILIAEARKQGQENAVEFLNQHRESLKAFGKMLQKAFLQAKAKNDED